MCLRIFNYTGCACAQHEIRFEACILFHGKQELLRQEARRNRHWVDRLLNREPPAPRVFLTSECTASPEVVCSSRVCPECVERMEGELRREREEREQRERNLTREEREDRMRREVEMERRERERRERGTEERRAGERKMSASIVRLKDVVSNGNGKKELKSAFKEAKEAYLCIKCLREERLPGEKDRAVNSGFCCTNGVDEWEVEFGALVGKKGDRDVPPTLAFTRAGERAVPSKNSATYTPPGQMLFPGYGEGAQMSGGLGVDERQWGSLVQTGYGTIPPSPRGQLPPTPSRPMRGVPQTESPPRTPARPTQLPLANNRPLPDIPNFRPGVSDSKKNLALHGLGMRKPSAGPSPSGGRPLGPKLIKVPSTGRRDTTIAVKPIIRHETEPLPKGYLDRKDAVIVKAKTFQAENLSNAAPSPGLRKPFSYEGLAESFSMNLKAHQPSSSRSMGQPPSSGGVVGGTFPSTSRLPQPQQKPFTRVPTLSALNPRQPQASSSMTQKSLPPSSLRQPNPSSFTIGRYPALNPRQSRLPAPNVNKTFPPLPSPRYPSQPSPHSPPSSARIPGPIYSPSSSHPRPPHQGGPSVRGTPPSSMTPRRPPPGDLSVRTTPSSLTPEQSYRGDSSVQTTPSSSSSVRTTPPSSSRPILSKDFLPPKPRYPKQIPQPSYNPPPSSKPKFPQRERSPPPPSISPLSSPTPSLQSLPPSPISPTNERWEDPRYQDSLWEDVVSSSAHLQSAPIARESSPSPVSPLSTPHPGIVGRRGEQIRDQFRPAAESSGIELRRRERGVLTIVDDEIDDLLDLWSGPAAMTRAEREERRRRGGEMRTESEREK